MADLLQLHFTCAASDERRSVQRITPQRAGQDERARNANLQRRRDDIDAADKFDCRHNCN